MGKLNKKILIVEDEEIMLESLVDRFTEEGFWVVAARNGEEGFSLALKEQPDLILLDIILPKVDGMTMMKKLRKNKWGETVPIILLTNLSLDDKILEGVTKDLPVYYLVKTDYTLDAVVAKVKERLGI